MPLKSSSSPSKCFFNFTTEAQKKAACAVGGQPQPPMSGENVYQKSQQVVVSTRKRLTFHGEMDPRKLVLDLIGQANSAVERIRRILEDEVSHASPVVHDAALTLW